MILRRWVRLWGVAVVAWVAGWGHGAAIRIDYSFDTQNFFNTPAKRQVMELAAEMLSDRLGDSLGPIATVNPDNRWTAVFFHPGQGATVTPRTTVELPNLTIPADELRVYVGGQNLNGAALAQGGSGGVAITYTDPAYLDSVFSRGQGDGTFTSVRNPRDAQGNVLAYTAVDFGPWGGALTFDSTATWSFEMGGPVAGVNDFLSVALHELTHLLGVGQADSWRNQVDATTSPSTFQGLNATLACGCPVTMSGSSHLAFNTMSTVNGVAQEAAMDPNLTVGTRKLLTDLDLALLQDIGWEIDTPTVVAGDVDGDGVVGKYDYQVITHLQGKATGATVLEGDVDGDGDVDAFDFLAFQSNWGHRSTSGGADLASGAATIVVPGPTGVWVVLAGMAYTAGRLRRR